MDLYAKLTSNLEDLASSLDARMLEHESNLKKLSVTDASMALHKDVATLSREFTDFRTLVWKSLSTMRQQLELLVQGLDRQETASRRKVLLFHGVPECSDITVAESVVRILCDQFKLPDISTKQFAACHRMGTDTSKPRPVLVRFMNYQDRCTIWNAKTALKDSGFTVSEFLTKTRHVVFTAARKHFGIRKCWTSEGKIVVLLDDKRRKIESMSELKLLIAEHPEAAVAASVGERQVPGKSQEKGKASHPTEKAVKESRSRRK